MNKRRTFPLPWRRALLGLTAAALLAGGPAQAESYPDEPVDWIVMWRAGGGADTATRTFTGAFERLTGAEIVVQNMPGGGGAIGYTAAKAADPDGYTLVTIQGDLPKYEPMQVAPIKIDDFDILAGFAYQSPVVVVRADAPWQTLEEFVSDAKTNPGKYSIGTTDLGGIFHQPMVLWEDAAGFEAQPVVLEGSQQQVVSLLGGHTDAAITWVKAAAPYVAEGDLRYLGYMASERNPDFPEVPTLKELGYAVVSEHPYGVGAPAGVPEEVKTVILAGAETVWDDPDFQAQLAKQGLSVLRLDGAAYRKHLLTMQEDLAKALALMQQ